MKEGANLSNKTIGIIILILVIILGVFALMNRELVKDKRGALEMAEIIVKGDEMESMIKFEDIVELGEVEFLATLDTSDTDPEDYSYTGIPLINLIEEVGISIADKRQVIVRGIDGYTVVFSIDEVMDEDNIYLAYKINDRYLDSRERGGSGPYQIIVKKDQFSQRWCKFVVELEIR